MKVLLTGGAGLVGSNLLPMLECHDVKLYDDFSSGNIEYVDGCDFELVTGSILDRSKLQNACKGIDAVIHLAAKGSVVESVVDPLTNFKVNVEGTLEVIEAAKNAGVEKLLFSSTGGALMGNVPPPVNELSLPRPISPYGASKLCGEAYLSAYAGAYGMTTISLRFANVYGPKSTHKKGIITNYIKALIEGRPLTVYGDGTSTRDYLYVSDLCHGIVGALEGDLTGAEVMHLATGVETNVLKLAETLKTLTGRQDVEIEYSPPRGGEVENNSADFTKARELIGFNPSTTVEAGLQRTYEWFLENWDRR